MNDRSISHPHHSHRRPTVRRRQSVLSQWNLRPSSSRMDVDEEVGYHSPSTKKQSQSSTTVVKSTKRRTSHLPLIRRSHCLPWSHYIVQSYCPCPYILSHPGMCKVVSQHIADEMAAFLNLYRTAHEVSNDEIEPLFQHLVQHLLLGMNPEYIAQRIWDQLELFLWPTLLSYIAPVVRLDWTLKRS